MADTMEIIISAVDSASEVFQTIIDSAQEMANGINDSIGGAGDDFETISSALEDANAEVERLTEELAGIYMGDIEGDADAVEEALARAQEEAQKLSDALAEASNSGDGLEESVNGIESLMAFQEISGYVNQLVDAMWQVTDRAGNVQDSFTRLGLAAEGAGVDVDTMKSAVSNLSDETGRAGGSIRESFIAMTSAGITDMETMQTVFKGASAQAFILGTDVESLANKFSGMAMKSTLSERTLKGTGVTMQELGEAMGLHGATVDEVKDKWSELDVNQRAAALGMAASMNEGKDANDEYKNSWQGLQDQIEIAKGKLEVLAGKVFLPVLIPIMQTAGGVLDWLGDTIGAVMDGPFGTFISIVGSAAGGIVLLVAAVTAITAGMGFFTASLFPAIAASWALVAPWLPWIALGAAIIAIIYKIGEAFGWWNDVGSMIDAIWAGIQRLWAAFINHPDVQAILQAIGEAWNWVASGIGWVMEQIGAFFGISTGGEFDVVRAIIDGIGAAWDAIKAPIQFVIELFTAAGEAGNATADAFGEFWNGTLAPFGEWLSGIFAPVWDLLAQVFSMIVPYVQALTAAFGQFMSGQMDLPSLVMTVLTLLFTAYSTIFSMIVSRVTSWGQSILSRGISAASNFVMGIVNRIMTLPGQVYTYLFVVVSRIKAAIQLWINAAVAKVRDLISKITSPFNGVANAISNALSGVVDALTAPFRQAWSYVEPYYNKIKGALDYLGSAIPWGGETAWGGEIAYGGETSYNISNTGGNVETTQRIVLDFANVPSTIDTATLIEGLSDRNVLRALTGNSDFQVMDQQAKDRLSLKVNRSRGL